MYLGWQNIFRNLKTIYQYSLDMFEVLYDSTYSPSKIWLLYIKADITIYIYIPNILASKYIVILEK